LRDCGCQKWADAIALGQRFDEAEGLIYNCRSWKMCLRRKKMPVLQALVVLVAVILIVWWALRRSSKESAREAPAGHAHDEPAAAEEHVEAVRTEVVELAEEAPEPVAAAARVEFVEPVEAIEPVEIVEPVEAAAPVEIVEPEAVAERLAEPVAVVEPAVEVKPDDLIIIEGIGPRISGVLKSHGVKTFTQLAGMAPEEIKAILVSVDERLGRIADPTTWPQQAALAAKGDLEGLQKLQDSLKAGRVAK
jgi:predicted flap endonuclease-1-like 5' DNA nuclease